MPLKSDRGQVRVGSIIDFLKAADRACLPIIPRLPAVGVHATPARR